MKLNNTSEPAFIVLAEDDVDDQEMLIEAFNSLNEPIEVHALNNGNKVIAFLESLPEHKNPCLIVLDYNLPEVNGSEILKTISSLNRFESVTKVVWSTSNSPVYEKICLDLGAKAYLVKPSNVQGLQKIAALMLELCKE